MQQHSTVLSGVLICTKICSRYYLIITLTYPPLHLLRQLQSHLLNKDRSGNLNDISLLMMLNNKII